MINCTAKSEEWKETRGEGSRGRLRVRVEVRPFEKKLHISPKGRGHAPHKPRHGGNATDIRRPRRDRRTRMNMAKNKTENDTGQFAFEILIRFATPEERAEGRE